MVSIPSNLRAALKSKRRPKLTVWEREDLEWFAAKGQDLVQRSALGTQLDAMRDNVRPGGLPSTEAGWHVDFHEHTASTKARKVAQRLHVSSRYYWQPAADVLLRWCSPFAVAAEGRSGGRLVVLYSLTRAAAEERHKGELLVSRAVSGSQKCVEHRRVTNEQGKDVECRYTVRVEGHVATGPALMVMARRLANPNMPASERASWARIRAQARELLSSAVLAYKQAKSHEAAVAWLRELVDQRGLVLAARTVGIRVPDLEQVAADVPGNSEHLRAVRGAWRDATAEGEGV